MLRQLAGATCDGPLPAPAGARMIGFRGADGRRVVAAWAVEGEVEAETPGEVVDAVGRDGEAVTAPNHDFRLGPSPVYLRLAQ
jgi:hypothetical protein